MDTVVALPVVVQRQLLCGSGQKTVKVDVLVMQVDIWVRPFLGQGR